VALRLESSAWRRRLPGAAPLVRRAARAALSIGRGRRRGDLCIVLANDRLQRRLNRDFRGADKSTNVLSFASAPEGLGDVVLALETVAREAREQGKSLADHVAHLVVHGVLHLLGYDHETGRQAVRMERLEARILDRLGIADPYRVAGKAKNVKRR
jgi:probable rRNA maturation factor